MTGRAGGRRLLITGNCGYVGSVLGPMAVAEGYDVTGLDTGYFAGGPGDCAPSAIPTLRKDLRDVDRGDLDGCWAVVHLAALSNDPLGDIDPALTAEINWRQTARLASLARSAGVRRFVFASSCSVYGRTVDGRPVAENGPTNPLTAYARSKLAAEESLHLLATARFSPVILRGATLFGESPRIRLDLLLNNLVAWAAATGEVRMQSDGAAWRPVLHVADFGRAMLRLLAMDAEAVHDRVLNAGFGGLNLRIADAARMVCDAMPGVRLTRGGMTDSRSYRVDFRAIEGPPFLARPAHDQEEAVARTVRAVAALGIGVDDLEQGTHARLSQLRRHLASGRLDGALRWTTG